MPRGRRQPRIAILGLPYFGNMLAGLLSIRGWEATFVPHPGRRPARWAGAAGRVARADLVYLVATRADRWSAQDLFLRFARKPVVVHWVGTDVLLAREAADRGRLAASVVRRATHLCDAPWLASELAALGIAAEYVALPIPRVGRPLPLPGQFHVLIYLPVDPFDREVFDMGSLLRLPGALPDVQFTLIPSPPETLPGPLPPNLRALDWVEDMDRLYRDITAMVRLTSHDGMSFMAVEAMSRGRYVLWTHTVPGVTPVAGFDDTVAALRSLRDAHAAGTLGPNEAGIAWVRDAYDPGQLIAALDGRLRSALAGRRKTKRPWPVPPRS
jgi:hypothetical protein